MWNVGPNMMFIHAEKTYNSLSNHANKLEAASIPFNAGLPVDLPLFGRIGPYMTKEVVGFAHLVGGQQSGDKTAMYVSASDYGGAVTIFTFGYIPILNG